MLSHVKRYRRKEIFGPTEEKATGGRRKLHDSFIICIFHLNYDDQMENQTGGPAARVGYTRRAATAQQAGQSAS